MPGTAKHEFATTDGRVLRLHDSAAGGHWATIDRTTVYAVGRNGWPVLPDLTAVPGTPADVPAYSTADPFAPAAPPAPQTVGGYWLELFDTPMPAAPATLALPLGGYDGTELRDAMRHVRRLFNSYHLAPHVQAAYLAALATHCAAVRRD